MGSKSTRVLRWQAALLLVLLTLTAALTVRVGQGVNPRYEVRATATVLAGAGSYSGQEIYGSPTHTTQVLAEVLDAAPTRSWVANQGLQPDYQVVARERRTFLDLTVHSDSADLSLRTADALLDLGRQELAARQALADMPEEATYVLDTLRPPTVSETVPWRVRNMAIVSVLGAVLSVLLTVKTQPLLENLGSGRPARARPRQRTA